MYSIYCEYSFTEREKRGALTTTFGLAIGSFVVGVPPRLWAHFAPVGGVPFTGFSNCYAKAP